MASTTNTITVYEYENLTLTCDASGYPSPNISWVRVNSNVLPNGELRHMVSESEARRSSAREHDDVLLQGTRLPLYHVTQEDRGIYRCLADNNVRPPAVHDATLLVMFRPVARPVQTSYGQAENRMLDVTIECVIAGADAVVFGSIKCVCSLTKCLVCVLGWPEPELQWYYVTDGGNWDEINNDDRHTINILLNHANILGTPHVINSSSHFPRNTFKILR